MHPVEAFIRALVAKWYIILMIGAFSVLYSTYKALNERGVIKKAEVIFVDAMSQIKGAAQNCMPLITDLNIFWKCLGQPNSYAPTTEDAVLENTLKIQQQGMLGTDSNASNAGTQTSTTTGTLTLPPSGAVSTTTQTTTSTTDTSSSSSNAPPTILP